MSVTPFIFFKTIAGRLSGKGLDKLPFAAAVYRFLYRKLMPRGIIEVPVLNFKMDVDTSDTGVGPYLIMHGSFAQAETRLLKKILKPGMMFIDVGANIGYFTLLAAQCVGKNGKVIAFEPEEKNFKLLEGNIKKNTFHNVIVEKYAVSDTIGESSLYLDAQNPARHSLSSYAGEKSVIVKTTTLDAYLGDRKVDVVKIDVEGAEPAVLKGMGEVIRRNKNMSLIVEFYPKAIKRFGYAPEQFLSDLKNIGFSLYRIPEKEGEELKHITPREFSALARGKNIKKLINIFCIKDRG